MEKLKSQFMKKVEAGQTYFKVLQSLKAAQDGRKLNAFTASEILYNSFPEIFEGKTLEDSMNSYLSNTMPL